MYKKTCQVYLLRDQAGQERRPQGLQQLPRDHAPVSAQQSAQQSSIGEDERGSWPQAPRPAGWLPRKQITCEPDCQSTHHFGAVAGVELPPLHQLHRLWEGLRQCGQRDAVEAAKALWSPREDHHPHLLYLATRTQAARSLTLSSCQKALRSRLGSVKGSYCHHFSSFWSSTGSWRLQQQAGTMGYSGHPGCSWMTLTLQITWRSCHTTTNSAGQDHLPGDHISWERTQDQQEENRADED